MALVVLEGGWMASAFSSVGVALLAGLVTLVVALLYHGRTRSRLPDGVVLLIGLGTAALLLNTRLALTQFVGEEAEPLSLGSAVWNVGTFVLASVVAFWGRRVGEQVASEEGLSWDGVGPGLSPIVRATGRFITVTLPDEIEDIEGYDPVPEETKAKLAGRKLDFPRGLTVDELRGQLAARLKEKHNVGYVDADLSKDGGLEHLALGQRAIGLGPLLPPGKAAVAVRSDPPLAATPGDAVHVWRTDEDEPQRVGRGEIRATQEGLATVATDRSVARRVDPDEHYRLVTVAGGSNADREFASLLRRGDETLGIVEFGADSPLVGVPIRALDLTVIAVETADGHVETLPGATRVIQAGERIHAIGRPEDLRKLKASEGTTTADPGRPGDAQA